MSKNMLELLPKMDSEMNEWARFFTTIHVNRRWNEVTQAELGLCSRDTILKNLIAWRPTSTKVRELRFLLEGSSELLKEDKK